MSVKTKLEIIGVALLILISLSIRLTRLDILPWGLAYDEAAYAYNAFSLWTTGRDEYQESWPLFLKSFGEYKPAGLSYLIMPLFLNGFPEITTIRAYLSLLSLGGVVAFYWGLKKVSGKPIIAGLAALYLDLTPAHLHYGKLILDPMIALTLQLWGWYFYETKQARSRWLGVIFWALAMWSYNAQRLVIPLLLMVDLVGKGISRKDFKHNLKYESATLGILLSLAVFLIVGVGGTRIKQTSFFQPEEVAAEVEETWFRSQVIGLPVHRLTINKLWVLGEEVISRSLKHLDPDFLFFDGNLSPRHGSMRYGNLLLIGLPFIVIGFGVGLSNWRRRVNWLMLVWFGISLLPGGLSSDIPHSGRVLSYLIPFSYWFGLGMETGINQFNTAKAKRIFLLSVLVLGGINLGLYVRHQLLFAPEESVTAFQGQLKPVMEFIHDQESEYDKIYFKSEDQFNPSYVLYAWYNQLPPKQVWQFHQEGLGELGKMIITNKPEWPYYCYLTSNTNVMVIGPAGELEKRRELTFFKEFSSNNRFHPTKVTYKALNSKQQSLSEIDSSWSECQPYLEFKQNQKSNI